ncbi:MAG: TIGR00268 family protein, partial [Planctomycetota bacterium]
ANADDAGDYRPGAQAAADYAVRSPLADCGFAKADVRAIARHWGLPVADKPASPCLASRLAYGVPVTPERLDRVEQAEKHLRGLGLIEFRVRYHGDDLARIEAPPAEIARLADAATRGELVRFFSQLGFRYVTLDLAGFRSGSLNAVLPAESLGVWSATPSR